MNNEIEVSVDAASGGFLVFSEVYYPGWKAFVDNTETKIYKANYAFRAIQLMKGQHEILMVYKPMSVYSGLLISAFALCIIIFYSLLRLFKK